MIYVKGLDMKFDKENRGLSPIPETRDGNEHQELEGSCNLVEDVRINSNEKKNETRFPPHCNFR